MEQSVIKVYFLMLIIFILANCQCLQAETKYKTEGKNSHIHNITHNKIVTPTDNNLHDLTSLKNNDTARKTNENDSINPINETEVTGTERQTSSKNSEDEPLPIPIMVASPAVAVGVFVFICVAYKWHATQLDAKAKEMASNLETVECPSPCVPCSPCRKTQRLLPPSHSIHLTHPSHSDSDLFGAMRKNSRTPSPILLSPPRGFGSHRGSSWSALSDQDVICHSPSRHSTVLL